MLHPQTFEFLKWLEDFNDKKFFDLYKPLYLKIKESFDNFIDEIITEISKFDKSLEWLKAKQCVYRIYKDQRFPKNREAPYKTNLGWFITPNGKKFNKAWYYIHIENLKTVPLAAPADPKKKQKPVDGIFVNIPGRLRSAVSDSQGVIVADEFPAGQFGNVELLSGALFNKRYTTRLRLNPLSGAVGHLDAELPR